MKLAFGYCRVSTVQQSEKGVSLDTQQVAIKDWCALHGYELRHIYCDQGISGGKLTNRPEAKAAIAAACKDKAALIVFSLSRLARSTKNTIEISERLDKAGADLVSLSENLDTTSASGKMVFRLLAVLAEFERDLVSERTTAALQYKKSQGQLVSGKNIPYGYDAINTNKLTARKTRIRRLVPNDEEQKVIADMRAIQAKGFSYARIAHVLNEVDIPTRKGGSWLAGTVWGILRRAG